MAYVISTSALLREISSVISNTVFYTKIHYNVQN